MDKQKTPLRFSDFLALMKVPEQEEELPLSNVLSKNINCSIDCTERSLNNKKKPFMENTMSKPNLEDELEDEFESTLINKSFDPVMAYALDSLNETSSFNADPMKDLIMTKHLF